MAPNNTESKTIKICAAYGWYADRCAHKSGKLSRDWFEFGDILAVHPLKVGMALIQSTTTDNMGKRHQKILDIDAAKGIPRWVLSSCNLLELWGFASSRQKHPGTMLLRVRRYELDTDTRELRWTEGVSSIVDELPVRTPANKPVLEPLW